MELHLFLEEFRRLRTAGNFSHGGKVTKTPPGAPGRKSSCSTSFRRAFMPCPPGPPLRGTEVPFFDLMPVAGAGRNLIAPESYSLTALPMSLNFPAPTS